MIIWIGFVLIGFISWFLLWITNPNPKSYPTRSERIDVRWTFEQAEQEIRVKEMIKEERRWLNNYNLNKSKRNKL